MMILQFQFALQHTIITARTTAKPNDRFGFNTNYHELNIERNENTKMQAKSLAETAESLGNLKLVF
jgi:hypothetical protein